MKVLRYSDFKSNAKIPFFSDIQSKLIDYPKINRNTSIIIFISYVWYSNYSTEMVSPSSLYAPDDPKTQKIFHLIEDGIETLVENLTTSLIMESYVWIDCACMDITDGSFMKKKLNLDEVISCCDCIMTPLLNVDSFFFESDNLYDKLSCGVYRSWIGSPSSYLSRSWCLLEFWYGMILPSNINNNLESFTSERINGFKGNLADSLMTNHRPHYLFAKDEEGVMHLFLLPRVSPDLFESLSPEEGNLSREEDRIFICTEFIFLKNYLAQLTMGYEGELSKGLKHGKGKLRYKDGSSYEGDWKHDTKEGNGIYVFPNGDIFEGQFVSDCIEGEGKLTYKNGNIYQGQFMNNLFHGEGSYYYSDGNMYRGSYEEGKRCGQGRYTFCGGGFYEGEFSNDFRHGKGLYFYPNGCKYEGEFNEDHRHGYGKYFYVNGDIYEGQFQNGHFNGKGKYTSKDGDIFEGEYKDDKKHGKGKITYRNGQVLHVEFVEGKEVSSSQINMTVAINKTISPVKNTLDLKTTAPHTEMMPHIEPKVPPKNPRSSFCALS